MDTLHKILDLMWKLNIDERTLCERAGINKSAVTDWKKGKTKSYMRHLDKIALVLNTSVEYLRDEADSSEPSQERNEKEQAVLEQYNELTDEEKEKAREYIKFLISQRK